MMEDWVRRALLRWPNVPALYGWLKLDRRGRWLIKGESISRRQILDVIDRNYAVDEHGCWYFQNGPQRGYIELERAPFIVHVADDGSLHTHNHLSVERLDGVFMDEDGGLFFKTEHGPAALRDGDLDWALERMRWRDQPMNERVISTLLASPSGSSTEATFVWKSSAVTIERLDASAAPARLGFVRVPQKPESKENE